MAWFNPQSRKFGLNNILHIIITILLPPLGVYLKNGAGKDLLINIILCLCFYLPGILHGLWIVTK